MYSHMFLSKDAHTGEDKLSFYQKKSNLVLFSCFLDTQNQRLSRMSELLFDKTKVDGIYTVYVAPKRPLNR